MVHGTARSTQQTACLLPGNGERSNEMTLFRTAAKLETDTVKSSNESAIYERGAINLIEMLHVYSAQ